MKRMTVMLFVLGLAVLMVQPAVARVDNVRVGGDITVRGFFRDDYDLSNASDDTRWYNTITRVLVGADLTDNVYATIRFINERDWDTENLADTDVDIDLAYIRLQEILSSALTLDIGRQEIVWGNGLIIADAKGNRNSALGLTARDYSARKAFDAVRAGIDLESAKVDVFTAKIDETFATDQDNDLYGLAINVPLEDFEGEAGVYAVLEKNDAAAVDREAWTLGVRGNGKVAESIKLSGEVAKQFGDASKNVDANGWAVQVGGTYTVDTDMSPSIGLKYTFLSGDDNAADNDQDAWLTMFPDQVNGEIASYLTSNWTENPIHSNINIINVNGSIKPVEKATLSLDYYFYKLNENLLGNISAADAQAAYTMNTASKDFGQEVDLNLTYDYTEDVSLGLLVAFFDPDDAFASANDETAKEVVATVSVAF